MPFRALVPEGWKAMLNPQVPPGETVVPAHVFPLIRNSAELLLEKPIAVALAPPVLVTVTDMGALVDPTVMDETNVTGAGAACKLGVTAGHTM